MLTQTLVRVDELLAGGVSAAETARRTGIDFATVERRRLKIDHESPVNSDLVQSANTLDDGLRAPETEDFARASTATTRQEVARLLSQGHTRAQIARVLDISKSTVTYHARRLGGTTDAKAALRYDWTEIQAYYDAGHSMELCIERFGFSRQAWHGAKNRGVLITRPRAMSIDRLLSSPRTRHHLKRRLMDVGLLPTHCQSCGISAWRERPLSLELHHVNGDGSDNRLENLEVLCPNCHSQTDSWGGRNRRSLRAKAELSRNEPVDIGETAAQALTTPAATSHETLAPSVSS